MVEKTTNVKRTTRASKTTQQGKVLAIQTDLSHHLHPQIRMLLTTNPGHLAAEHSANMTGWHNPNADISLGTTRYPNFI